jgi:hypothetical protein
MREMKNSYKFLVRKPKENIPLGKARRKWDINIMLDLGKQSGEMWSGFVWLRIGTSDGVL